MKGSSSTSTDDDTFIQTVKKYGDSKNDVAYFYDFPKWYRYALITAYTVMAGIAGMTFAGLSDVHISPCTHMNTRTPCSFLLCSSQGLFSSIGHQCMICSTGQTRKTSLCIGLISYFWVLLFLLVTHTSVNLRILRTKLCHMG